MQPKTNIFVTSFPHLHNHEQSITSFLQEKGTLPILPPVSAILLSNCSARSGQLSRYHSKTTEEQNLSQVLTGFMQEQIGHKFDIRSLVEERCKFLEESMCTPGRMLWQEASATLIPTECALQPPRFQSLAHEQGKSDEIDPFRPQHAICVGDFFSNSEETFTRKCGSIFPVLDSTRTAAAGSRIEPMEAAWTELEAAAAAHVLHATSDCISYEQRLYAQGRLEGCGVRRQDLGADGGHGEGGAARGGRVYGHSESLRGDQLYAGLMAVLEAQKRPAARAREAGAGGPGRRPDTGDAAAAAAAAAVRGGTRVCKRS
jgi:hypothetical protein